MSKRIAVLVALAAGCVLGGVIGFILHAPGRPSTWTDARGWATFAVVVLGFVVAGYELDLQRRQFAEQAKRNEARDDLLDRQRRELQQTERQRQREQAEGVDVTWANHEAGQRGSSARVINDSPRPIRQVACGAESRLDDGGIQIDYAARSVGLVSFAMGVGKQTWRMPGGGTGVQFLPVIKSGGRAGFEFTTASRDSPGARLLVRFTDDADLHWQLDNDLHLEPLDNRDDW